jgi:hypothetical protein
MDLAGESKQRAWWQLLCLPDSTFFGLLAETSISDCGLGVIPGLLQTDDYAGAMVGESAHERSI